MKLDAIGSKDRTTHILAFLNQMTQNVLDPTVTPPTPPVTVRDSYTLDDLITYANDINSALSLGQTDLSYGLTFADAKAALDGAWRTAYDNLYGADPLNNISGVVVNYNYKAPWTWEDSGGTISEISNSGHSKVDWKLTGACTDGGDYFTLNGTNQQLLGSIPRDIVPFSVIIVADYFDNTQNQNQFAVKDTGSADVNFQSWLRGANADWAGYAKSGSTSITLLGGAVYQTTYALLINYPANEIINMRSGESSASEGSSINFPEKTHTEWVIGGNHTSGGQLFRPCRIRQIAWLNRTMDNAEFDALETELLAYHALVDNSIIVPDHSGNSIYMPPAPSPVLVAPSYSGNSITADAEVIEIIPLQAYEGYSLYEPPALAAHSLENIDAEITANFNDVTISYDKLGTLPAPTNLQASENINDITISWDYSGNATFVIYRKVQGAGDETYAEVGRVTNQKTFTDLAVPNGSYTYTVATELTGSNTDNISITVQSAPSYSGNSVYTAPTPQPVGGATVFMFNFNATAQSVTDWEDVTGNPHTGTRTGTQNGVTVSTGNTVNWSDFGGNTSNDTGGEDVDDGGGFAFPSDVVRSIMYSRLEAVLPVIEITGLSDLESYTIELMCSFDTGLVNSNSASQTWGISGDNKSLDARSNTSALLTWTGKNPSSGQIDVAAVDLFSDGQFFCPCGIRITKE